MRRRRHRRRARPGRMRQQLDSSSSSAGLSKAASNPNATMVVNFAIAPATLDPDFTEANQEVGIVGALYSTLLQQAHVPGPLANTTEANLSPTAVKAYLATSWQFSNGDKTLTFHLRPGLKFPSGDPLDAEAVVWSLKRDIKSESGGYSVFEETEFKPRLIHVDHGAQRDDGRPHYRRPGAQPARGARLAGDVDLRPGAGGSTRWPERQQAQRMARQRTTPATARTCSRATRPATRWCWKPTPTSSNRPRPRTSSSTSSPTTKRCCWTPSPGRRT